MNQTTVLLDPTAERSPEMRERVKRPKDLKGITIGLLNISKPRGDIFLDEVEKQLSRTRAESSSVSKTDLRQSGPPGA